MPSFHLVLFLRQNYVSVIFLFFLPWKKVPLIFLFHYFPKSSNNFQFLEYWKVSDLFVAHKGVVHYHLIKWMMKYL